MEYNVNFGFYPAEKKEVFYDFPQPAPNLIDDADIYDIACPINPVTGQRANIITILRYAAGPNNQAIMDRLLCELPVVHEIDASDDVKLDMLVRRMDMGTFAERDQVFKRLDSIKDILFPKDEVKNTISFVDSQAEQQVETSVEHE